MPTPRFSVAALLLALTACAGGLAVWRMFIYEPPTHKIAAYEKAPGTRGNSIQAGPNRIGLRLIARNDRDGSIHYDRQRSSAARLTATQERNLAAAAAWLDIVHIELDPGPELIDVIEVRIFDHEKRELLPHVDAAYGWQLIAPNVVQVYGLGKQLPKKVDVWFRAHSYDASDHVVKLPPTPGSTASLPNGTLQLTDIRPGQYSFDGRRLTGPSGRHEGLLTAVLTWNGQWTEQAYQVAAVTAAGMKAHTDSPHYLAHGTGRNVYPIHFNMLLSELDHFEFRPFGGRERFFFEAVKLPKTSSQPLSPPPTARVSVAGQELEAKLHEFAPFDVKLAIRRGHWASGTAASGTWAAVTPADQVERADESFTVAYHGKGVANLPLHFRFIEANSKLPIPEADLHRRATMSASGAAVGAGYIENLIPLERIDSVEIHLAQ